MAYQIVVPKSTTYDVGRDGRQVRLLVLHSTCGENDRNDVDAATAQALTRGTINWLSGRGGVSAHYVVGAEPIGAPITQIVKESDCAWHAGGTPGHLSVWTDPDSGVTYTGGDVNKVSIGIEVFGAVNEAIGKNQEAAIRSLVADIISRYPILAKPGHIVSHYDLKGTHVDGRNSLPIALDVATQVRANSVKPVPQPPAPLPIDPNPKGYSVGAGVLAEMRKRGDVAATNEQFFTPNPNQPAGLGQRSMTWGSRYRYVAFWKADGSFDSVRVYQEV